MKLKKISEPIAVSAYSKQEAVELLSILRENGYTLPFNSEIDYTGWCGIQMYYKILPEKVVIYSYWMPKDCPRYTLKDFIHKMEKKETTEVKINIPEGYEIDKENSTFECIKFRPKRMTYADIAKALFKDKATYFIDEVASINYCANCKLYSNPTNATSSKQLKKLFALNKLMNTASYLNKGWKPDWEDEHEIKYFILLNCHNVLLIDYTTSWNREVVFFKTQAFAQQAIDILGEDTIRLAFSTDW